MSVKTYDWGFAEMEERGDGDYVLLTDYESLQRERDALKADAERYRFIRRKFWYGKFGISLPRGHIATDESEEKAQEADMAIDKELAKGASQ